MPVPSIRQSSTLTSQLSDGLSRSATKRLTHLQEDAVIRGIVAATDVQAKGFVTLVAIQLAGSLSREATFQHGGDPDAAERTALLVNQFTMAAASEIGRM